MGKKAKKTTGNFGYKKSFRSFGPDLVYLWKLKKEY
jgi:hypothetical protein